LKKLEKNNKKYIEKIMKEISQPNFLPKSYLDRLFKYFYGNKQYYLQEKISIPGK
jgi:hypothetical protein